MRAKVINIPRYVLILIIALVIVSCVAVILSLTLGLEEKYNKDCNNPQSDGQKYQICKELACRTSTILEGNK